MVLMKVRMRSKVLFWATNAVCDLSTYKEKKGILMDLSCTITTALCQGPVALGQCRFTRVVSPPTSSLLRLLSRRPT